MIQFWWRSGSRFGSGSPKSEIWILQIGGGLCCLSISSSTLFLHSLLNASLAVALTTYFAQSDTHTRQFNGLFSRTAWVSRHQKGKPFWILLKQEKMGWRWHQLDHMQIICTTLQTDNHTSTPSVIFYGPYALLDAQPTVSKH